MYDAIFVGARCAGIRGHGRDGRPVEEHSRMVIGADGANSFVARAVRAPEYDVRPVAACGYYSYFSGVRQDDIELYVRDHHAFGGAPTNDGLHLVMVNRPGTFRPCALTSRHTSGGPSSPRPTSRRASARAVAKNLSVCDHRRHFVARFHVERECRLHHACREGRAAPQVNDVREE